MDDWNSLRQSHEITKRYALSVKEILVADERVGQNIMLDRKAL